MLGRNFFWEMITAGPEHILKREVRLPLRNDMNFASIQSAFDSLGQLGDSFKFKKLKLKINWDDDDEDDHDHIIINKINYRYINYM